MLRWTQKEDNTLKRHYADMGTNIIELMPHRTRSSIRYRARTLSLCSKMGRKPATRWKPEEDLMVRDLYGTYGSNLSVYLVGKSPEAVEARARQLGVLIGRAIKPYKEIKPCQK